MQRAQMRQTIAASDLRDHQLVTQELIQRVNMLDAAVADARRADSTETPAPAPSLNDVLRDARDTISTLGNTIAAKDAAPPTPDVPVDTQTVDDDLETRRRRLSQ